MENEKVPTTTEETNLSRREALKVLTAASGAIAAAAFLQGKWTKPVVEAGVVPAHAQSSRTPPEVNLTSLCTLVGAPGYSAGFTYYDPLNGMSDSATLNASVTGCGTMVFQNKKLSTLPNYHRTGGATNGVTSFTFTTNCNITNSTDLCIQLTVNGRQSQSSCISFFGHCLD